MKIEILLVTPKQHEKLWEYDRDMAKHIGEGSIEFHAQQQEIWCDLSPDFLPNNPDMQKHNFWLWALWSLIFSSNRYGVLLHGSLTQKQW